MIYTAIWPLWVDGRLKAAMKGNRLRILFNFKDFPPATLLDINDGSFRVFAVDPEEDIETIEADAAIYGNFKDLIEMTGGMKGALRAIITRKIKVKKRLKFIKFLQILGIKKIDIEEVDVESWE
ncbi:MAG: SCP2 sterol-binding domain-containing protein [Promethearchaeota archaeon]